MFAGSISEWITCSSPLSGYQLMYTECCCHYGVGWGLHCQCWPQRNSDHFTRLCECGDHETYSETKPFSLAEYVNDLHREAEFTSQYFGSDSAISHPNIVLGGLFRKSTEILLAVFWEVLFPEDPWTPLRTNSTQVDIAVHSRVGGCCINFIAPPQGETMEQSARLLDFQSVSSLSPRGRGTPL
ncbi:uncharacterized protein LOC102347612 isoform X2 [Latimeria chalumnae]